MTLKFGSSIIFAGENLFLDDSYLKWNNGEFGGALLIRSIDNIPQTVFIERTIFNDNAAGHGGAICFIGKFLKLYSLIENNYFFQNWAAS